MINVQNNDNIHKALQYRCQGGKYSLWVFYDFASLYIGCGHRYLAVNTNIALHYRVNNMTNRSVSCFYKLLFSFQPRQGLVERDKG